jgi:hypothetical protein
MAILDQYLSKMPVFEEKLKITSEDVVLKDKIYRSLKYQSFVKDDTVFSFGDYGSLFFIIVRGEISVQMPVVM